MLRVQSMLRDLWYSPDIPLSFAIVDANSSITFPDHGRNY
jgi:hypothetical protein